MKKFFIVVTRSDTYGGVHKHIDSLISLSSKNSFKPVVICGGEKNNPYIHYLESRNIEVRIITSLRREISPTLDLISVIKLKRALNDREAGDIVSIHSSKVGLLGRIALIGSKASQNFFTIHGWSFNSEKNKFKKSIYITLEYFLEKLNTKLLFVSNTDYEQGKKMGMTLKNAHVILNSLSIAEENRYAFSEPINKQNSIIMVARMDEQKDHLTAITAFKDIKNKEYRLILLGDGKLEKKLKLQVSKLGLTKRVEFLGFQKDIVPYITRSKIFILITNWEGLPYTCIEGLAAGLPLIVSNVGGNQETVIEGKNGFLIEKNNTADLTYRLNQLISREDLIESMGKNSRILFESKFANKIVSQLLAKAYELT